MSRSEIEHCFREILNLAPDQPVAEAAYRRTRGWNSLAHMRLVAALETRFGVSFTTEQILELDSFAGAVELLRSHGAAVGA